MTGPHITRLQDLFQIGQGNPISLRAISPFEMGLHPVNECFNATDFPEIEDRWAAAMSRAKELNAAGYNLYTLLNPIKPEFPGPAVRDADIVTRRLLLIDLDRADVEVRKVPATNEEIKAAFLVADQIEEWLRNTYGASPTRVMSGNGIHLLYRLPDLPNDKTTRDRIASVLKTLAGQFNSSSVEVDTTVFNASRITKLPGTVARKGTPEADRPYREACFV